MPSVMLCSDEPVLAQGLIRVLSEAAEFHFSDFCSGMEELRDRFREMQPDILLLDLTSEVHFGVLAELQEIAAGTKIVLWVRSISTELAMQAMSLGVRGILRRTVGTDMLLRCLTRVSDGELWFEKSLTDTILGARRFNLTRREGQLVALLSQGLKNKEIAYSMDISEGSVKVYLSRLFQKLGVKDRFELALFGLRNLAATPEAIAQPKPGISSVPIMQGPRTFYVERIPPQPIRIDRTAAVR
jgi:DNA-binding NarL/FixJ family response regulator